MLITARDLLLRGLLAGLLAGLAAFAVAYVVGEPSLSAAIAYEEANSPSAEEAVPVEEPLHTHEDGTAHSHADEGAAEVPRSLQATAGLLTATVVAGTTLGGLVGVLSALALGRFGRLGPRGIPLLIAGLGFVTVYLMPFLTYPPNPPAVGSPDTVGYRTALYFLLVAISLVAGVTAVLVARRLAARWGAWYATLAAGGGYLVVVLVAGALMPTYAEVPADFSAEVLYAFRRGSLLTQLALWGVLGLACAELTHRLAVRRSTPALADSAA